MAVASKLEEDSRTAMASTTTEVAYTPWSGQVVLSTSGSGPMAQPLAMPIAHILIQQVGEIQPPTSRADRIATLIRTFRTTISFLILPSAVSQMPFDIFTASPTNPSHLGDWAGQSGVFNASPQCQGSCQTYVQNNPQAYANAYWSINSLKVYTSNSAAKDKPDVESRKDITSTAYGPFTALHETKTWKGHGENTPTAAPQKRTRRARDLNDHAEATAQHV